LAAALRLCLTEGLAVFGGVFAPFFATGASAASAALANRKDMAQTMKRADRTGMSSIL
jgi:hypothetical protein